jgi:hypothetical protein
MVNTTWPRMKLLFKARSIAFSISSNLSTEGSEPSSDLVVRGVARLVRDASGEGLDWGLHPDDAEFSRIDQSPINGSRTFMPVDRLLEGVTGGARRGSRLALTYCIATSIETISELSRGASTNQAAIMPRALRNRPSYETRPTTRSPPSCRGERAPLRGCVRPFSTPAGVRRRSAAGGPQGERSCSSS